MTSHRHALVGTGCGLVGLLAGAAVLWGGYHTTTAVAAATVVLVLAVGWSFSGLGIVAWKRWPSSRTGLLMVGVGLTWFARCVGAVDRQWAFDVGVVVSSLYLAILGHAILTYPGGRIQSGWQLGVVVACYACTVPLSVIGHWFVSTGCRDCHQNLIVAGEQSRASGTGSRVLLAAATSVIAVGLVVMAARWRSATPARRRSVAPAFWGAVIILLALVAQNISAMIMPAAFSAVLGWVVTIALVLWPLGLVAGMAQARLDRSSVADLVVELGRSMPPGRMREALARALHDPTLVLALWLPDLGTYVDAAGRPVPPPAEDDRRALTRLERDGQVVAALGHDAALKDQPELLSAVASAAGMAVENERLHAEVLAHLAETRQSRLRILEATDVERRRIERNLHDGAQQRMINVLLALRLARLRMAAQDHARADMTLEAATTELTQALTELRDLARGIYPAVLSDGGLTTAVRELGLRCAVAVRVDSSIGDQRFSQPIEEGAYYAVSEALANASKHAAASQVVVSIDRKGRELIVEICDDGVGGASLTGGTGLRGLQDRVNTHAGRVRIDSAPDRGTRIVVSMPCG